MSGFNNRGEFLMSNYLLLVLANKRRRIIKEQNGRYGEHTKDMIPRN